MNKKNLVLKREIIIHSAYDRRNEDPSKDYGIGACRIFFVVSGKKGAITVNFGTNWYLPSTVTEYKQVGVRGRIVDLEKESSPITFYSWDIHSKKKMYLGQKKMKACEFVKGGCYCDGSCSKSEQYLTLLLQNGSNAVLDQLEKDYKDYFGEIKNDYEDFY